MKTPGRMKIRTTCPLCPYGCGLELAGREGFFAGIEYIKDSLQEGRLCPKGNAIPFILSHPKRLYSPKLNSRDISWGETFFEVVKIIKNYRPENIAVGFDSYLTLEEKGDVIGFAQALGVKDIFYLNPENIAAYRIEGIKEPSFSDLKNSDVILIIGDLFSRFPIFAKPILDSQYEKKGRRLFVFDLYPSRLFGFADSSILLPFGREVEVFLKSEEILATFAEAKRGVLILDLTPGKFLNPLSLSLATQEFLLRCKGEKFFLPVWEREGGFAGRFVGDIAEDIGSGRIKVLLFFGEGSSLTTYLPSFEVNYLIATASFFADAKSFFPSFLLPVPHIVEREGNFSSFWGKVYKRGIPPFSGTKGIREIIGRIANDLGIVYNKGEVISRRIICQKEAEALMERRERFKERGDSAVGIHGDKRERSIYLVNDEEAIEYGGFFDKGDRIRISPKIASELQLREGERISIEDVMLRVETREGIPEDLGLVSLANPKVRRLFTCEIDKGTKEIIIRPVFKRIEV